MRVRSWIGAPGDYLQEPNFSSGAWRASAGAYGALDALVEAVGAELCRKGQAAAPMQLARLLIARDTARLWLERAAAVAEADSGDPAEQVPPRSISARIAVESACLDALGEAECSLGLAAFVAPHPVELLSRDLGTYLRQPGPVPRCLSGRHEGGPWRRRG